MAKDGTSRGGARIGSGRKPNALTDKISQGKDAMVIEFPETADFKGEDIPPVKDFMKAAQKSGVDLCAEDVFRSTYIWLKERGCGLYIVSNCLDGYLDILYRNLDVKRYIDGDAWLHHPMHCKADNIRYIVDKYQLTDACYVGDIQGDYEASRQAGVEFVFAAYGYGDVPEAKYIINQFSDLGR